MKVGEEIRRRRLAAGLTLATLSERSRVSVNQLSRIENGARSYFETIEAVAKGLRIPLFELCGGPADLSPAGMQTAQLFEASTPQTKEFVLHVLQTMPRRRR